MPGLSKSLQKQQAGATAAFHRNHSSTKTGWGERWHDTLEAALRQPTRHVALVNQFAPAGAFARALADAGIEDSGLDKLELASDQHGLECYTRKTPNPDTAELAASDESAAISNYSFPAPSLSGVSPLTHWNLDAASVLAALALAVQPGHRVLDLCAAPGGKSVALAQALWSADPSAQTAGGLLHSNEFDGGRNKTLSSNLAAYLPLALFEGKQVKVLRFDAAAADAAARLPNGPNFYDRVLVDVPCTSTRHVLQAQARAERAGRVCQELAYWKPSTAANMAKKQVQILMTALQAVLVGGRVVYATCSVEQVENDGVVEQVKASVEKKKPGWNVRVERLTDAQGGESFGAPLHAERTACGQIVLPDRSDGWGPLYFAVLTKIQA